MGIKIENGIKKTHTGSRLNVYFCAKAKNLKGQIIKSTGSWYLVRTEEEQIWSCRVRGKMRTLGLRTTNPVAVGDVVFFEAEGESQGIIRQVEERRNYIIRKSSNLSKQAQIIAANIDQAGLIASLKQPDTPLEFIDRFLVTAEAYRIPAFIIFNKTDLYGEEEQQRLAALQHMYEKIGYPCFSLSLKSGDGLEAVSEKLKDQLSLLSGNSGVGKSSLINILNPDLKLKTDEISAYHQTGKHTTTFAEMHDLPQGGSVIDTPGIRGFGLIDVEREELYHFFPEIFKCSHSCKYYNCLHDEEPSCAVRDAVVRGEIGESRYLHYLRFLYGDEGKYR